MTGSVAVPRVLVLGGTGFVGRHVVVAALARGWDVSLFNRGVSGADLFPTAELLVGDRYAGDLSALSGSAGSAGSAGEWDVVVDVNGYLPRDVRASASLLRGRAGRYVFVSTVAVYADVSAAGIDESSPVSPLPAGATLDELTAESYGPLKVLCEEAALSSFDGPVVSVRPGTVVGPWDPLGDGGFGYWVRRCAVGAGGGGGGGGPVECPARPDQPVQVTDARMLASFLLDVDEVGVFNAVGVPTRFDDMLAACGSAPVRWTDDGDAPFVLPHDGSRDGSFQISPARAVAAGMRHIPLHDTAAAILSEL